MSYQSPKQAQLTSSLNVKKESKKFLHLKDVHYWEPNSYTPFTKTP